MSASTNLDRTLAALSDRHRRRIVDLLGARPCRAGEIARAVGLKPSALSRHLRALKASGLIEEAHPDFDARVRIYTLRSGPMAELKTWLEHTEQLWTAQLATLKTHLESNR